MEKFIIKAFGVNQFNFWGWVAAGLLVVGASLMLGQLAFLDRDTNRGILIMLGVLGLILLGIFCVLLSLYCSLLAEKLEKKHALRGDPDMERLDWAPAAPASSQVKGRD
jgi:hypothetical protein